MKRYYFEGKSPHSASSHPLMSLSGSMGDCHPAVRGAVDPYDPWCNFARSVERSGVLPQSQMGETAGDQRECFSLTASQTFAFVSSIDLLLN